MPPVIIIIAGLAGFVVSAGPLLVSLVGMGLSMVLSGASKLLSKKPNFSSLTHDSLTRAVTVRQP